MTANSKAKKVEVKVLGKSGPELVEIEVFWPPADVLVNPLGAVLVSGEDSFPKTYRMRYRPPLISVISRLVPLSSFVEGQEYREAVRLESSLFPEDFLLWLLERFLPFPISQYPAFLFSKGKRRFSIFSLSREGGVFSLIPLDPYSKSEAMSLSDSETVRVDLKGRIILEEEELSNILQEPFSFSLLGIYPLILLEASTAEELVHFLASIYRNPSPSYIPVLKKALESIGESEEADWFKSLWEHQKRGIAFMLNLKNKGKRGGYLAFDMGTGKTLTSLSFARIIDSKRTLVVCPKAVISTWEREARRWFPDYFVPVPLNEGNSYYKTELVRRGVNGDSPTLVIVNYDSLIREPLSDYISSVEWDLLILDEAHFVKSHESKRFKVLKKIKRKFSIALSGTPMVQGPLDIWTQAFLLDKTFLGENFYAFRHTYAILGGFGGRQVVGYKNQDYLAKKLSRFMMKVSIDDVLELPEAVSEVVEIELEPEAKRLHDSIYSQLREAAMEGRVGEHYAALAITRMMQITGGVFVNDETGEVVKVSKAKRDALEELLSMVGATAGEPVVVFGVFHHDLDTILEVAKNLKISAGELSGRRNDLDRFQKGAINLIAVQIQAGGVGVDLSRARYSIYYSVGYSLGNYLQSLARTRRPGQTRKVVYLHLVSKGTIDERVFEALRNKSEVISYVLETIS